MAYPRDRNYRILKQKVGIARSDKNNIIEKMNRKTIKADINETNSYISNHFNSSSEKSFNINYISENEKLPGSKQLDINENKFTQDITKKSKKHELIKQGINSSAFGHNNGTINNNTILRRMMRINNIQNKTSSMIENEIAKVEIINNLNETLRSTINITQPLLNLANISNTERFSSENTKKTKSLKNTNSKENVGLIVFFLFLILFAVTAPLGKDKLICLIMTQK